MTLTYEFPAKQFGDVRLKLTSTDKWPGYNEHITIPQYDSVVACVREVLFNL